ncbi:N-acetyltransferase [Clostridia bacterium]|nr:N-acetyltransferase [Clostridia bacterium]
MEIIKTRNCFKANEVWKDLRAFNAANNEHLAQKDAYVRKYHNFVAQENGKVLGGALCKTIYNWLYIDTLKVKEEFRGQDIGSKIIAEIEKFAREKGFEGLYVDTFGFQARPFYEKQGFALNGTIEGYPPGSKMFILTKKF